MKITIETIPHGEQRYPTAGDWVMNDAGDIIIHVSETGDWRYNAAVAVHELVEALLCRGVVLAETVDAFDRAFIDKSYHQLMQGEPGDDPTAPYAREHCFATAVERMLIAALGVSWAEYDAAVEAL